MKDLEQSKYQVRSLFSSTGKVRDSVLFLELRMAHQHLRPIARRMGQARQVGS